MSFSRVNVDRDSPATGSSPGTASGAVYRGTVIALGSLLSPMTSVAEPTFRPDLYTYQAGATGSIEPWAVRALPEAEVSTASSVSASIGEIRRRAGLTWDQLARLFGVSRRSAHFWASGKPVNAGNEERVRRVLALIRESDQGTAPQNRALLFTPKGGVTPFELMAEERFQEAALALGTGSPRSAPSGTLSAEARASREPLPVDVLAGASQEPLHAPSTRSRVVRTVRKSSGGRD